MKDFQGEKLRFGEIVSGIYPQEVINRIKDSGYDPVIVGYDHPGDQSDMPQIQCTFGTLKQSNPNKQLKVAHEIVPPVQLKWIKDFLELEEEYKKSGTVNGEIPRQTPSQYRQRLLRNHAEHLALWLLDNDFDVIPIESPAVENWIREDSCRFPFDEERFGWIAQSSTREFLTAIKRDIHTLHVMDQKRPDILSVGTAHALKLDLLLDRSGDTTHYILTNSIQWERTLKAWAVAHNEFRRLNQSSFSPVSGNFLN